MSSFLLEIITPDRIVFTDNVEMVVVPSSSGTLGILPKHVPLFALLSEGELKIKRQVEDFFLSIGGGVIEVTKNKVMILVTRAVKASELNEQEIIQARQKAQDALSQKPTGEALISAQVILRQSLIDLKVLRRRKKIITH